MLIAGLFEPIIGVFMGAYRLMLLLQGFTEFCRVLVPKACKRFLVWFKMLS